MKKNFEVTIKNYDCVLIEDLSGRYYSTLVEISYHLDYKTLQPKTWKSEKEFSYRLLRSKTDTLANWIHNPETYVTKEALEEGHKQLRKANREMRKQIKLGKNHPIYQQMLEIVQSKTKHFTSDFTFHDTLTLSKNPTKFIWIVREAGTWVLQRKGDFANAILKEYLKDSTQEGYIYDKGKLVKAEKHEVMNEYNYLPEN
jgi:hypothetical protein